MPESRVIHRYVKSLFSLAEQQNVVEEVHHDMNTIATICKTNRTFILMLRSPIIRHEKKREVLEATFKGKIHPVSFSMLDLLTRKNRESLVPEISMYFHVAYNEYKQIGQAVVYSATKLDHEVEKEIHTVVKKITDRKDIELEKMIDEKLLGGFVLDVDGYRVDASVKNKLHSLKMKFNT